MGGLASILGLLLQVALVVFLARLAFRYFQRRTQPAFAGAGPAAATLRRETAAAPPDTPAAGGGRSAAPVAGKDTVGIGQTDLDSFERLLGAVQEAYGAEDVGALRALATPEVVSFLAEELADNASRGVVNRVADVKLLQGDLAEAWREGSTDYATVAMRFGLRDWTVERATGRVVEGDPDRLTEATEVWTFRRGGGGSWLLSAIQRT
jgi:predicted lipid-binding transport protein (Tim44 family)